MGNKIEGGPVCEECKGARGFVRPYTPYDYIARKVRLSVRWKDCAACQGTGRKPLSEWTGIQKLKWVAENPPKDYENADWTNAVISFRYDPEISEWGLILTDAIGFATVASGKEPEEVLTAAVAAIAERKGDA